MLWHKKPLGFVARSVALILAALDFASPAAAQAPSQQPQATEQPMVVEAPSEEPLEPKPEQQRPSKWGEPTEVQIGIYVIDVDAVDSANQNFSASVFLQAQWQMPLLRHDGPAPLIRRTTSVWTPRLVIVNQQQAWSSFPSYVEIAPDGTVTYRQKTWGWFSQPLDLREFPFDKQNLTVHVVAAGLRENEVKMVPLERPDGSGSGLAKSFSLPDFSVTNWRASAQPYVAFESAPGVAGFIMEIDVERLPDYYIWKVIFPLCLIIMMSWVPRWLDPTEGGTSIGISTTSLLTLVAYLFAIMVLLPRVSYLTRIDLFILISTVLVFAALVQTVATVVLAKSGQTGLVSWTNWVSRFAYPIVLLVVLAISFG
jgi:hypothetical protein